MPVSSWSTTAVNNGTALGIDIAEDCNAANINNALREAMAQIKAKFDSVDAAVGTTSYQPLDTQLTAIAGTSPTGNQVPMFTSSSAVSLLTISAFIQTLLDDADASAACATLGAVRVSALTLANPGYVKFLAGTSQYFMVAWGTFTASANTSTAVSYAATFPTASFPVVSGGLAGEYQDNPPDVSSASATGFSVYSASDSAVTCRYIAVGY